MNSQTGTILAVAVAVAALGVAVYVATRPQPAPPRAATSPVAGLLDLFTGGFVK